VSNPGQELEKTDCKHKKGRSPQSWNDTNLTGRQRTRHYCSRRNNTKNTTRLTRLCKKASVEQKNIYTLQQNTDAPLYSQIELIAKWGGAEGWSCKPWEKGGESNKHKKKTKKRRKTKELLCEMRKHTWALHIERGTVVRFLEIMITC
jgi:hypothetical protein